ncbi:hypothetical protein [Mycobacterium hubeiense]|uniref:hypothetical protein n=1 Tax=Mycobacterium hubeiense TaxID=1867256 RepID=UPI000C7F2A11|nr:hypothetical protein [Mycobacterium sp. QGD 101]
MALVFHYSDSQPLDVGPALIAGLPALLFGSSVAAFVLVLVAGATVAALNLPAASNHLVLTLLVALAFGAAALWALTTRDREGSYVERWLDAARSPIGLTLLGVYLFTVFHKLNSAFFDPSTSCSGSLLAQLLGRNGLEVALNAGVVQSVAIATVLIEVAVLVLLAIPRLRCWGVLAGVAFHALLALASFYDFATIVFALYVLLVPAEVFAALAPRAKPLRRLALAGFAAHVLLSISAGLADTAASPVGLPWHTLLVATWFIAVGPLMFPLVWAYLAVRDRVETPGWRLRPVVLLIIPLLAFVNGVTPYLGLKTVANYSMFSNLHTEEGRTNHLLPGVTAIELTPYQRDTVDVTALYLPPADQVRLDALHRALGGVSHLQRQSRWIAEGPPVRIPWLELRRTVLLWQSAGISGNRLEYVRDGQRHVVSDAIADGVLGAPMPWWQRHLLAFRAVDSRLGTDHCRW